MIYKLRLLLWYIKRPMLYPHLFHVLTRKLRLKKRAPQNDTRKEAASWCAELAVDTNTALLKITGLADSQRLADMFPEIFTTAHQTAKDCPVKMGGAGDINLIYWLAEHLKARNVLETGVAYGWSSLAILLSLQNRPGSKLISTDMPYPNLNNDQYVGCVVPAELRTNWRILHYADRQALPKALKELGAIDMCCYDSDKSYEGRMWAYPLLWKALRKGGFFISDDIGDNIAFKDFCNLVAIEPTIIDFSGKYVGVLIKPND